MRELQTPFVHRYDQDDNKYFSQLRTKQVNYLSKWGTTVTHDGLVLINRRIPERHSHNINADLLADDIIFRNLWFALCYPDRIVPQKVEYDLYKTRTADSYLFCVANFCKRNNLDVSSYYQSQDLINDYLMVAVDFGLPTAGTDGATVTYFFG